VGLDQVLRERIKRRERDVAEMTPEACLAAAGLLRDAQPDLASERQRELAEEMAVSFEGQAAETPRPTSS
jgi:hypothetical protein